MFLIGRPRISTDGRADGHEQGEESPLRPDPPPPPEVHPPTSRSLIKALPKQSGVVFPNVNDRQLLTRLKELGGGVGLSNPKFRGQDKLQSFRHHPRKFASLCANRRGQIAYKKALTGLGHSSV